MLEKKHGIEIYLSCDTKNGTEGNIFQGDTLLPY